MRERLPSLVALLLLVLLVLSTWWAANYTLNTVALDPPRRQTHEPDTWAQNFVMLRTNEEGIAINRLEGAYMLHYPDDDSYHLDETIITLNQIQNPIMTAQSDNAIMDQDGARIQLVGNALLQRQADANGDVLSVRSERIVLYPNQDTMETDDPAVVRNGSHTLQGTGMTYNNTTRQLHVHRDSHVIMTPTAAPQTSSTHD